MQTLAVIGVCWENSCYIILEIIHCEYRCINIAVRATLHIIKYVNRKLGKYLANNKSRVETLSIITAGSLIWSISFAIDRFKGLGSLCWRISVH